jgi:hypothetical protein
MSSSAILRRVVLVRTDVSEQGIASIITVTKIGELGTLIAAISLIFLSLMMEMIRSSETSVLTRATQRNIPEDGILQLNLLFSRHN